MTPDETWLRADLLDRFTRYVKIHTTSNPREPGCPSSSGQWDLARLLVAELKALGLAEVELTEFCYVRALVPAHPDFADRPVIAFLAHLDTSPDCSGQDVQPQVHTNYDGGILTLPAGNRLDPADFPMLALHKGETIITSNGATLLGADDKAGVAEIMSAVRWLLDHPEHPHGPIEIIFTPDEEIGRGVDKIPRDRMQAQFAFTMDGDEAGTYNIQCFSAWTFRVIFSGRMIHPGSARGKLINAVAMANQFMTLIPRSESPETTDGPFGYYCLQDISGTMEQTTVNLFIRDFAADQIERRKAYIAEAAALVEKAFPGGQVKVEGRQQYLNMYDRLRNHPEVVDLIRRAIAETGLEPRAELIRGGTDGSRLTELGLPTPNIFAGGHNFHSLLEWVPLESMMAATQTILNLARLWVTTPH